MIRSTRSVPISNQSEQQSLRTVASQNRLLPEHVLSLPNDDPRWGGWVAYAEARREALDNGS